MSDPSEFTTWLFPTAVFVSSFLASPHCAGMCGPLILAINKNKKSLISYHLGRGISYTALGAGAGELSGSIFRISASPLLSATVIAFFASLLLLIGWKTFNGQSMHFHLPSRKLWTSLHSLPVPRTLAPAVSGLINVFLPCGHLYTFALGATTTGSALKGAALMFFFWLGTLPVLGLGVYLLRSRLKRFGPASYRWAALILVISGFISLGSFASHLSSKENQSSHHSQQTDPKDLRCH